ncbi:MAG TPA: ketopantoate reductase family protein [Candidatus Tectomicrobia bacterium]
MHIVILGAGAIGTVLGAHLARAGEDVTLLARGQRAAYLQTHGATITGLVDFTVPVTVVTDPQQVQAAEVLIVTVKTYDMAPALQSIKHLQVESVLSLQNGVLKNEQLARTFGWDKVLGTMTHFSAETLPTGAVYFRTSHGVYLGEWPAGTSPRVQQLGDTFTRVGIMATVTPHIQSFEWSKYVAWVCLMAPAVLTRLESAKILQNSQMASLTAAILHEMVQMATRRGMPLHDIALFPTKTLSQLAFDDTVAHLRQIGDRWASRMPTAKLSALQDLEQGKRLEVEETLGYAVQQGAALGIPTPTMDICYKLIAGINHYLQ